jgi:hypothetical protein
LEIRILPGAPFFFPLPLNPKLNPPYAEQSSGSLATTAALQKLIHAAGLDAYPDGSPKLLPNYIQSVRNGFALGMALDPVVLDLSGSGVFSGPLYASRTYFDLQGTGFQIRTSWAAPRAGLLVRPNADGSVTGIQNLFGNATTGGAIFPKVANQNHANQNYFFAPTKKTINKP